MNEGVQDDGAARQHDDRTQGDASEHLQPAGSHDEGRAKGVLGDEAARQRRAQDRERTRVKDEHKALQVDLTKFQHAGWLAMFASLAATVISITLLERSRFSSLWSIPIILIVGLGYIERSRDIGESFMREVRERKADAVSESEKRDNENGILDSESAEWMNAIVAKLWPVLNTDLMLPLLDIVEDALKNRFPNLIDAVRIDEIDLGVNAFRIVSFKRMDSNIRIAERHELESDSSRYVNMEVEFELRGEDRKVASENTHMLVYMALGTRKFATIEVPVFVELSHASGTMRVRVELISDPPFVRMATVSFPEMIDFTISAKPLKTVNVLRLPMLSTYVHQAVEDIISSFIAPNAFTLDVSRMITGQDVDMETRGQGLVALYLHSAKGLGNLDHASKSDPFVIVSYVKLGKTLYTTRVIHNELNPQWEEAAFIPITTDAIREGESLSLHVWDSDKITADDSMGGVLVSLNELYEKPGKMETHTLPLKNAIRNSNSQGDLTFSVGYFTKVDLTEGSPRAPVGTTIKLKVSDPGAPLSNDSQNAQRRSGNYAQRIKELMDAKLPPSPKQSSGILAVHVHQMSDLEIPPPNRALSLINGSADMQTPSTYAQIFINDEMVYQTRLKRMSSAPYINARTEAFCRDWTRTRVDIVILDYRERENDAVLGLVSMRLSDIFTNSSQVTAWRPLQGGVGTGRCRISVLIKPIRICLPPTLRGWSVGTVLIDKIEALNVKSGFKGVVSIRLAGGKYRTQTEIQSCQEGDDSITWSCKPPLRLPLLRRYQRSLQLTLRDTGHTLSHTKNCGEGTVWLCNILDDAPSEFQVDLFDGDGIKSRRQNNDDGPLEMPTEDAKDDVDETRSKIQRTRSGMRYGGYKDTTDDSPRLRISMRFSRGMSSLHAKLVGDIAGPSLHDALRMRDHAMEAGERKAGSARYHHRDADQRAARLRALKQAKDMGMSPSERKEAEQMAEDVEASEGEIHLGNLEQEPGGGLREDVRTTVRDDDEMDTPGADDNRTDEEDWSEDGAELAEEADGGKRIFGERRENLRSDRIHQKGPFQVKVARTFKWLKDGSSRKTQEVKRKLRHTDGPTAEPEQEGISHIG